MMLNSNYTSGTDILRFIDTFLSTLHGNKSLAMQKMSEFYQTKWTPPKVSLLDFNNTFNDKLSLVFESNPTFAFEQVLHTWIRALPTDFSNLQMKLNKSTLDSKWTQASTVAQLFILTIEEMRNCNINYSGGLKKPTSKPKPLTVKLVKKAPTSDRGQFPEDFPSFDKLFEKVKEMVAANDTRETIEANFQSGYPYPGSCWLCRICPKKEGSHKSDRCPILKNTFSPYLPNSTSCRTIVHPPGKTSVISRQKPTSKSTQKKASPSPKIRKNAPPSPKVNLHASNKPLFLHTPERMCYDTGTTPKSLCSDKKYF